MSDTIPTLYEQDRYDEWIDEMADLEVEVLEDEWGEDIDDISYDDIRRSVSHSGQLAYSTYHWTGYYHDILRYTHTEPIELNITLPEDDPHSAMADVVRRCVVDDVVRVVRARFEDRTDSRL